MCRASLLIALFMLLSPARVSFSQNQVVDPYSLQDLISRAVTRSEPMKAAQLRVEASEFSARQSRAWQNPEISIAGGRKHAMPQDPSEPTRSGLLYEAAISQPFFFPGKQNLRGEIGKLQTAAAKIKSSEIELALIYDVIRLSYEYEINRRKKLLAESRMQRFGLIQSYVSGHLFASPQQKTERLIVESRLNNLTADALKFNAAFHTASEKLNFLVGLEQINTLEIVIPWLQGKKQLDQSANLQTATEHNYDLVGQRLQVISAKKENRLAKWENFPDFALFGSYAQEKAGDTERFLKGGISFTIPLLNQNRGSMQSTARKIEAENTLLRFGEQQIQSQLAQLHVEYEVAREIVQRYPEESLSILEKKFQDVEREFRKGRVSLISFIELDSEIGETYERTLEAQAALLDKVLAISYLAGDRSFISRLSEF